MSSPESRNQLGALVDRINELLLDQVDPKLWEVINNIRVELWDGRTQRLDPSEWYCKVRVMVAGPTPFKWDNADPYGWIVSFFLEDLHYDIADNFRDTVIHVNLVNNVEGSPYGPPGLCVFVAIFTEGAGEKKIYYGNRLLHHHPHVKYSCTNIPLE